MPRRTTGITGITGVTEATGVSRRTAAKATAAAGLAVLFGATTGTTRARAATRLSGPGEVGCGSAAPPWGAGLCRSAASPRWGSPRSSGFESGGATSNDGAADERRHKAALPAERLAPRTLDVAVPSVALGRSAPVRLILPSGFDPAAGRTYPVLYLLHGAHDDYTSWTRETDIEAFTEGRDLIVAMPDAGPTGIPSAWRDGLDYETFQVEEVPALLARDYRASGVRAVAGVSTGGYGAMAHAARHPGVFTAAASYSGVLDTTAPGVPAIVDAIVAREGLPPVSLWGNPIRNLLTWRDFNPRARADGLRGTALYVSQGSGLVGGIGDWLPEALESALWPSARGFAAALARRGIPATTHFYAGGGHSWAYWKGEFTASWPILAHALGVPE